MAKTFLGVFQSAVQTALTIDQNEVATRDAQNQSALGILGKKKEVAMLSNQVKKAFLRYKQVKCKQLNFKPKPNINIKERIR